MFVFGFYKSKKSVDFFLFIPLLQTHFLQQYHELTDALRKNKTIDWNLKESARAGMRRLVKRLLKKYKYPPEGQEDALNTIMEQCEMWSENS